MKRSICEEGQSEEDQEREEADLKVPVVISSSSPYKAFNSTVPSTTDDFKAFRHSFGSC